jgi:hypothetical protein
MQLRFRLFQERPDTISLDCCEEFFEGFLVRREGLFPDGQTLILIDDLQRPAARASNGTKNVDQDRYPIIGKLAREIRMFLFRIFFGHLSSSTPFNRQSQARPIRSGQKFQAFERLINSWVSPEKMKPRQGGVQFILPSD